MERMRIPRGENLSNSQILTDTRRHGATHTPLDDDLVRTAQEFTGVAEKRL